MLQCKTSVSTPRPPRRHRAAGVIAAGLALAALAACGQKGPLTAPHSAAAASAPAAK
ncbi:MAG: lipoprotein [Piscinibacter sp.]